MRRFRFGADDDDDEIDYNVRHNEDCACFPVFSGVLHFAEEDPCCHFSIGL